MAMSAVAAWIALAATSEPSLLAPFWGPQDSYLTSATKDGTHRSALLHELGINNNMQDNPSYPDRTLWANFSSLESQLLAAAGTKGIRNTQTYYYINLVDNKKPQRICITGFENGVSTAALLSASETAAVDSFDVEFPEKAVQILQGRFPNRLTMHLGDTAETVADHLRQCDMVVADGSQTEEGAYKEIVGFQKNSAPGSSTILVSDDTFDCDWSKEHCEWDCISCDCEKKPFCNAKSRAWKKAVENNIITQISCKPAYWHANQETRDYPVGCFGKFKNNDPGHNSINLF